LFAFEQSYLQPLPVWLPPVYLLHQRLVDVEGYVSVDSNRYSVPDQFIGLQVEVRQTKQTIEIYRGPRLVASHQRVLEPTGRKYRLEQHRRPRGQGPKRPEVPPEEKLLLGRVPEIAPYIQGLRQRYPGRSTLPLRRLLRLVEDYPRQPLLQALQAAAQYGLYDLERVETIILRQLAREYFQLTPEPQAGDDEP
jgi:hypothetical protein